MNQAFIYNQMFLSVGETRNIKYLSIYIEGKQPLSIYYDPVLGSGLLGSPAICPVASTLQHSLYRLSASTFSQAALLPLSPISWPPQVTLKWLSSCSAMALLQLETIGELVFVPLGFCLPTKM